MNRAELKRRQEAFDRQLEERNKAYFAMADNLTRNGQGEAAARVRALCLSREEEKAGTFIAAILGVDVSDEQIFVIQFCTDIVSMLQASGAQSEGGGVPVLGFLKACFAAASYFDELAREFLVADDGGPVTDEMVNTWRAEASALAKKARDMMSLASPG
jgi:hypothetical protein